MHENAPFKPRLVLHNIYNYGHFLVYASVFTRWALSRGFEVHLLGRGLEGTPYARRFAGHVAVVLHDMDPGGHLPPGGHSWAKPALLRQSLEELLRLQRELAPQATLLLCADDYLFEGVAVHEPGFRFEHPTTGLTTFGHREHYTGHADAHASRLVRLVRERAPFRAILTLDEHQAADTGTDPGYLAFLPDIFAEDMPGQAGKPPSTPLAASLAGFLEHGRGPVIPVIGKFDRRKNNLWVLEEAAGLPDAAVVVLGERVPGQGDDRIDAVLGRLRGEGRLFEATGFVPEELFHQVLAHERARFLALPYSCHYGSSGIQLMGLAHGKPTLVPSGGLMARRVHNHGLGAVYRSCDRSDFARRFRELLETDPASFQGRCREFMAAFSETERNARLDRVMGIGSGAESAAVAFPAARDEEPTLHEAMALFWKGDRPRALDRLEELAGQSPGDAALLLRKGVILFGMDRLAEAGRAVAESLAGGAAEECDFFVRQALENAQALLDQGDAQGGVDHARKVMGLLPEGCPRETLHPETWRLAGVIFARGGEHGRAVDCFRAAIALDPAAHDIRLNLSDVLRYAGRFEESMRELDALEALAPQWHGLRHKRAQVLYEKGEAARALALFRLEPAGSPHHEAAREYIRRIEGLERRRSGGDAP